MKTRKKFCITLAMLFAAAFLGVACNDGETEGAGGTVGEPNDSSQEEKIDFKAICEEVGIADSICVTLGGDGSYCTIDTNPYDLDDFSMPTMTNRIKEFNEKLGLPEYVYQEMITTSYLQGKQTETFGEISVTWYYHPDKGLNATYKLIG